MPTDSTAITTEIPSTPPTAQMPAVAHAPTVPPGATGAAGPAGATGAAGGAELPSGVEPCPHCGALLALDQRYCLECGAPRTYLSGMLLERLRAPGAQASAPYAAAASATPGGAGASAPPVPPLPPGGALAPSTGSAGGAWQRGSVLTLIASVGVLLLAMGVGVLIGRSGGSSNNSATPAVVTVPAASTGAATTATTPTSAAETPAAKTGAGAAAGAAGAAKHKAKAGGSGVGETPSKPAPPSALNNLRTGSGQSYEQKSKNLPNVVSTG